MGEFCGAQSSLVLNDFLFPSNWGLEITAKQAKL